MPDYSVILQSPMYRALVQENALDRFFSDGLYPTQLFRQEATPERWEANIGDNKTFTGKGLLKPKLIPLIPGQDPVPSDYKLEQWTATMAKWADTIDTNLPTAFAAAVNKLTEDMKQLGLGAGQTLNRINRYKLFNAGDAGWTVADGAQNAVTSLRVKRIAGFTRARRPDLTAGSQVRYDFVSANNPLPISYIHTGTTAAVNVIGFTADLPGDELGTGVLLLDATITVSDRDPVLASSRTFRVIAGGGNATDALTAGSDIIHLADIRTIVARMRTVNVAPFSDGYYHFHIDPTGEAQLFADNEVQRLCIGLPDNALYKEFMINRLMGCTFFRNNENPVPENVEGGTAGTFTALDPMSGELWSNGSPTTGVRVHRALAIGMDALKEYYVDTAAMVTEAGVTGRVERGARVVNNGIELEVDRIKVVQRAPLDRLQEQVANSWTFQGDFVVRTDGATGDAAAYKRVGVICHTE